MSAKELNAGRGVQAQIQTAASTRRLLAAFETPRPSRTLSDGAGLSSSPPAVTPLAQAGRSVERSKRRLLGCRSAARQHADLPGEGGSVVVDRVVDVAALGELHHVNPSDLNVLAGGFYPLELSTGESPGCMPLHHGGGVVADDTVHRDIEVGERGQ